MALFGDIISMSLMNAFSNTFSIHQISLLQKNSCTRGRSEKYTGSNIFWDFSERRGGRGKQQWKWKWKCTWSKIFLDFWERRGGRGEEQFQQARGQTQEPPSFECPPRKWLIPGCVMANLTKYARIAALIPLNSKQWITHSLSPKDMSRAIRGALRLPISSTNYVYKVGIKLYCSPRPILWAAQHWWQTWWFPNWRTSVPVAKRSDR